MNNDDIELVLQAQENDEDAKNYLWDEIRMKKLYRRKIVVRDCNGKFDQTIQ